MNLTKLSSALVGAANSGIAVGVVFARVTWSAEQTVAVHLVVTLGVAFGLAIYAHLRKGTPREPVVISGSLGSLLIAVVGLLLVFSIVTTIQAGALTTLAAAVVVVVAFFVRDEVTPVLPPPGAEVRPPLPPAAGR